MRATPATYGGCETNSQAGIDGRNALRSKGRNITDNGETSCPYMGVTYEPTTTNLTTGDVTAVITTR
ncbi:MAG: hypothetical protein LBG52_00550 [Candidatus Peribacteria bacterium]|nr:hypothetical protein [Candidatus Peribacteria bacterium]